MSFWQDKRVMVTGGAGFLGRHIVGLLGERGAEVFVPRSREYNLVQFDDALRCLEAFRPQVVIHSAAFYGGIWINQLYPGRIFYENLVMGAHVMEAARLCDVEKFVAIGTACSYPGYLEGLLKEENLWDGIPHETVVNYGLTKKMMAIQGWAYSKQYGLDSIHLILTNLYGPWDTFNPERSHVVAALIRKFVEARVAGASEVEVWGSGRPVREFLYVEDCAEGILRAGELYDDLTPLNICRGEGTSIRELAELVRDTVGFRGEIVWNADKPDGQMMKVLDASRMKQALGWSPPTSLAEGLRQTVDWYAAEKLVADLRV
ncbi:MAG: NAD-dependent epimerase/dehydratase family protein [Chloroflexi bacterium]|nr:NAD-dependent epimerase/dehydratase family protein [Chloroflexota bacterium]